MRIHQIEDLQVREARFAADAARASWLEHIALDERTGQPARCTQCSLVAQRRGHSLTDFCPAGVLLRIQRDRTAAQLRRERADAAKPNPNQQPLFDL